MIAKICGLGFALMGTFIILVSATARDLEGNPLSVSWAMGIIGFSVIQLGGIIFFADWDE